MHLSVTCTRCQSKYQLDPGMRGKKMRCPNPICRAVIEVRDDSEAASPMEAAIAEVAPVEPAVNLPIEEPPPALAKPVEVAPAPVVRKPAPKPVAAPPEPDFPDDFPGDDEVAPEPVGTALATEAWQPEPRAAPAPRIEVASGPTMAAPEAPRRKSRRALWAIAVMLLILGAVAGGAFFRVRKGIETNETERWQQAKKLYDDHAFADALAALQSLQRDVPDSAQQKRYRFFAELSDARQAAYSPQEKSEEAVQALDRVLQFAGVYKGDALLKEQESDLWDTLQYLTNLLTSLAEQEKSEKLLPLAKRAWAAAKVHAPPGTNAPEQERKLNEEWTRIDTMLAAHLDRVRLLDALKKAQKDANARSVQEAFALTARSNRHSDPEIRALLDELIKAHREQVRFIPADPGDQRSLPEEDTLPSLSVTPSLLADRGVATSKDLVLALARGVLYAVEPAKGEIRWVRRVGLDTQGLPLRVPADAVTPELALVASSDQRSLSAVIVATGETFWQTPLSEVAVGLPVLVDRHVLVPTLAGTIDELEIAEGRRVGSYHVGQLLTAGGVHQPGTSLAYFPADEYCLYVIDLTKRSCEQILYTKHFPGSLRGVPKIAPSDKRRLLLWSQATGLHRAEIRAYELPIEQPEQRPIEPIVHLPGLSDAPRLDGDRLAAVSEKGRMSLWSFRQKGARGDPLLYPMLRQDFAVESGKALGHGGVIHADAENLWTVTGGRLQRVETTFHLKNGPGLLSRWPQPIALGTPLHAAEVRRDANGHTILYLTTQADDAPLCRLSAVDADEGKILWQRQLGVMLLETPRLIGEQILVRDASGLLRFTPAKEVGSRWRPAGEFVLRERQFGLIHHLLSNDAACVQLSWPSGGTKITVQIGSLKADEPWRTFAANLPAPPHGTPVLGDGVVLLPLANGIMERINLADGALINGPDWRAVGAAEEAKGHVVAIQAAEFILTDGSRGLTRYGWLDARNWEKRAATELAHRIVGTPVVVASDPKATPTICVADASDTLTLLDADRLHVVKRWPMSGKISAGPFVRAGKIGCIVGKQRLVWLDPTKDEPAWEYGFAEIVGMPHWIDGVLVVADVTGQILALDPSSGRPVGPGYTFKANVAPTAAPLPFGPGQAFVPLTDGTVAVLPLAKLR